MILGQWEAQWEWRRSTLPQRPSRLGWSCKLLHTIVTWWNFCSQILEIKPYTSIASRKDPSKVFLWKQFSKRVKQAVCVLFLACLFWRALGCTMWDILSSVSQSMVPGPVCLKHRRLRPIVDLLVLLECFSNKHCNVGTSSLNREFLLPVVSFL